MNGTITNSDNCFKTMFIKTTKSKLYGEIILPNFLPLKHYMTTQDPINKMNVNSNITVKKW